MNQNLIDQICINTIRFLSADAIQKANSGHPGMPMGCAPLAHLLFGKIMKFNPEDPKWINRDRFVLSAGHGSMLLYSVLHLCGYNLSLDEIKNFRQWGSITPGHPEYGLTPGVEATTGPLGQGIANAVGMAIARHFLAARFNTEDIALFDHNIYVIAGDGCMMEGITNEAASLAGHLKLSSLKVFYDYNKITIDGKINLAYSENVKMKYEALGWKVFEVLDVNQLSDLEKVVDEANKETEKPSLIIVHTIIGYGAPRKQNTSAAHGSPLGEEELSLAKKKFNWPNKKFYIPEEAKEFYKTSVKQRIKFYFEWKEKLDEYQKKYKDKYLELKQFLDSNVNFDIEKLQSSYEKYEEQIATRNASGKAINEAAKKYWNLIGGSADLAESNNTLIENEGNFSAENYSNRNIRFGIREHAMGAIANGICYYGILRPYTATFLVFSDYMKPAIRLASLSHLNPIYVFTHDSIGLGEDGPSHQPIEQLAMLRALPNIVVIRPSDANETIVAWDEALKIKTSPVALILTRQKVKVLDRTKYASAENLRKGAYILKDSDKEPEIIIMASGSEVVIALEVVEKLQEQGIKARCVAFPSWELFEKQSDDYKEKVLPKTVKKRIAIEAACGFGWERYLKDEGIGIFMESFGASAPYEVLYEKFGFYVENVIRKSLELLKK